MELQSPPFRKLKGYSFDPSLSLKIETALINSHIYKVPWEKVEPGPCGEYIEVIDYDPTTKTFYEPVDLNDEYILAQDGLSPSESNPKYHQQMCYSVAMTTIKNFERALGRPVIWNPHQITAKDGSLVDKEYVQRLRIYPHALRDANAFYSPQKKALLFGYFSSDAANGTDIMPNSLVFTCLSHDIIAHETTHAILDGIHNKYSENTNPDVLSFHEAIADIVALFQHFTFPEVLIHQISKTRGDLNSQNLLGELAQEFGSAIGNYGALRDAIGEVIDGKWKPVIPDGYEYQKTQEPHKRGSVLVSAVFEAFLTIYKSRTSDLFRIASGGTGKLPEGNLHPDLVNRLASEASKSAQHVLTMCIRALDYCPPVDVTFGDFLRAIITSDIHLFEEDNKDYRIAFIDAFKKRGIFPKGIKNLSEDSLKYSEPEENYVSESLIKFLRKFSNEIIFAFDRKKIHDITQNYIRGAVGFNTDGRTIPLHRRFADNKKKWGIEKLTGLVFNENFKDFGIKPSPTYGYKFPSFYIRSLKVASRVGLDGKKVNQIIITLTQNSFFTFKKLEKLVEFSPVTDFKNIPPNSITLIGGATLIFDLDSLSLRCCVSKPILDQELIPQKYVKNEKRLISQYNYQYNYQMSGGYSAYFMPKMGTSLLEPFSILHRN